MEYYAARHSWATLAVNKVGIDKYTVHAALNHIDEAMKVTDIYIERDFEVENEAIYINNTREISIITMVVIGFSCIHFLYFIWRSEYKNLN